MAFFSDGWWLLRVIWSESDTARVRSSPLGYNKTRERRPTMEPSWWSTFASNWPPPSRTGPPSQAWPVAPSNPTQHLHIPELWIGALSLSLLPLTLTALYLWPEKQGRGCFCCLNSTNHQTAHSWDPEPWPGTRTQRKLPPLCFLQSDNMSEVVALNVTKMCWKTLFSVIISTFWVQS